MIPALCPHCGTRFAIDPELETVTNRASHVPALEDAPVAFRPTCPGCRRRLLVQMDSEPAARPDAPRPR
jgi:hypothetical protein